MQVRHTASKISAGTPYQTASAQIKPCPGRGDIFACYTIKAGSLSFIRHSSSTDQASSMCAWCDAWRMLGELCYCNLYTCTGSISRLAVDMKFPIHIHIHIHRRLTCVHAAPHFCKIQQCKSIYHP